MEDSRLHIRNKARELRARGYSYLEISSHKAIQVPRSTVVSWCLDVSMTIAGQSRHAKVVKKKLRLARISSAASHIAERKGRLDSAEYNAQSAGPFLNSMSKKKAVLGALYLAEGTKRSRGCVTFGNSDPEIIKLYLLLLRECFGLDETKFRCTLQARAGQDIVALEQFWLNLTGIPKGQFYKARVDARGDGQLVRKPDYKGVCRIDYFSSNLLYEILAIGRILVQGP